MQKMLPPHLAPHVNLLTPTTRVRVNKPGQPRALPTILPRPHSDTYTGEGGNMLYIVNTGEWERPNVHRKEKVFGYEPGVIHNIPLPAHERRIGNSMCLHNVSLNCWIMQYDRLFWSVTTYIASDLKTVDG